MHEKNTEGAFSEYNERNIIHFQLRCHCSMSSVQHGARCFEMQRVCYSVTLLSRLQRVALINTQRVA